MDLKNTKATPQKYTGKPSKPQSRVSTTEKPSAELKSTYKFHQLGFHAETVVKDYFIHRGWSIESSRTVVEDTEIDLIVEKEKRKVILEVKYLDNRWRAFERVHSNQIKRLKRVLLGYRLRERNIKVDGYVVFVSPEEKLQFISLDEII